MVGLVGLCLSSGVLARAQAPGPDEAPRWTPTEADTRKIALLAEIAERAPQSRSPLLGVGLEPELVAMLAEKAPEDAAGRFGLEIAVAMSLMRRGALQESIAGFSKAVTIADAHPGKFSNAVLAEALYSLALAYFRLAETRNCVAHHDVDSCLFPLKGSGVHIDTEGAEEAQKVLARMIALDGHSRFYESRWLYNITHMALGTWPDEVPEAWLLPAESFASEAELARFVDTADERGLLRFTRAGSVVLDDFDGDGRIDVMTSSFDPATNLALFRNTGGVRFEDVTAERGLEGQLGGLNLVQADVNGDGRLDVLVLRGGHLAQHGEMPNSLLVQDEHGFFHDRTLEAGIEFAGPTQTAAFADVDLDGDLDLFIGYEALAGPQRKDHRYPSKLYENLGDGRFRDVTAKSGIVNPAICLGVAFGDIDGDGYPDLYLANQGAPNRLFLNEGEFRFREVAEERGVTEPHDAYGCFFFDYDNDGDLDLLTTFYQFSLGERMVAAWHWERSLEHVDTLRLYENDGRGHFTDVTAERGLQRVMYPFGATFGDLDGDGWLDVYFATGAFEMSALWPNKMFLNDRGKGFLDVTTAGGFGHLQKGQGVAFADLDDDGDQDLFLQCGGYYHDDGFGDVLFQNPGHDHRFVNVDLHGVLANRFGIGARIRVRARYEGEGEADTERDVYATVGTTGSFGGNSLRQEIGLGPALAIVELEVRWPGGRTQRFADVPLDARIVVREGDEELLFR